MANKPGRGAVPARGQFRWIRVRDTSTGHEYDVQERSLRAGMEPIKDYPEHTGANPRPTKHYVGKDGLKRKYVHGAPASTTTPTDEAGDKKEGGRK